MKPKKPFSQTLVGKLLLAIVPMILKNQKGIKGTDKVDKVDKIADAFK